MHTARSFIQEGSHVFRPVCRLVYRELKTMPRFTKSVENVKMFEFRNSITEF